MDRVQTYVFGSVVASTDLNSIQDRAVGGIASLQGNLTGCNPGERIVHYQSATDLVTGDLLTIDNGDWKDFVVHYAFYDNPTATGGIGEANDDTWGDTGAGVTFGIAYFGLGATDNAGNPVIPGAPPFAAAGLSWAPRIAANLWIFADPNDGFKPKIYNNTGVAIGRPYIRLAGTKTNAR